jgi:hypothetical protein
MICHRRVAAVLAVAAAVSAGTAGVASADTLTGMNWSGYVAHGARFSGVIGSWTEPAVKCSRGRRTSSAVWVGLGGYSPANALEQIGTDADCLASGRQSLGAWFELLPSPPHTIAMSVRPGDQMSASVSMTGHGATLSLSDETRHESYDRTMYVRHVDIDSADWIVEAPSMCVSLFCVPQPLANFRTVRFSSAAAITVDGQSGAIEDPALWEVTAQRIGPDARPFNAARPSVLDSTGAGFNVTFLRTGAV